MPDLSPTPASPLLFDNGNPFFDGEDDFTFEHYIFSYDICASPETRSALDFASAALRTPSPSRASTGSSPTAGASLPLSPPRLAIPGPSNMVYPSASTPTTPSYSPAPTTPSYSPRAATTAKKAYSPSSPAPPSSPSYSPSPAPTTPSYSPRAATTANKAYSPSSPAPPSSPSYSPSPAPAATQARGKTVYPTQPAPVLDLTTNSTPSPPPVPVRRGPGRPRKEDPAVGPAFIFIASEMGVEEGRPLRVTASRLQGEMFHFKVKWEGGETTWEPLDAAAAQYPHLVTAHLVRRGL